MSDATHLDDKLSELRRAFDESFAAPRATPGGDHLDVLSIRVGGGTFALRTASLAGIAPRPRLLSLPGSVPGLLGLAGQKGAVVPVYGLAALLGMRADERWRWLALRAGPVAFAFDELERFLRVPIDAVHPLAPGAGSREHVKEAIRTEGTLLPLVDLDSVMTHIERHALGRGES
ncbi:MAG TPA: chemotaxis protein CheW [Longimicrobium sp.]|nr:chemotaxis protein CheW [Longimicrobium sp.]